MAENTNSESFDPRYQTFYLTARDGVTKIPVSTDMANAFYSRSVVTQANYGSQLGATVIMLVVVLSMTPRRRFRRVSAVVNIAALVANLVRCLLLSLYFTSTWVDFYTLMTGDVASVKQRDYNISIAATVFNIPVVALLMCALAIQAWSMIQLWPAMYKWGSVAASAGLVVVSLGFKTGSAVLQSLQIADDYDVGRVLWVRETDLVLSMAFVSWFCFLFIVRLVMHMWSHRTILPTAKGLSAMEVLVMANGVLMLVPVLFAGLEFGSFTRFEAGSLTYTSVAVVLPLGTVVAQRLGNPSAFNSLENAESSGTATRAPFLYGNNNWAAGGAGAGRGVTSHIVSTTSSHHKGDPFERELASIDSSSEMEMERRGVRVHREIEHREERISNGS